MLDYIFIGAGVVLVITCLIVRDRTEYAITRMRAEFMALRTEEKRQSEIRDDIELMVAQAGEALMRADRRCNSLRKGCETVAALTAQVEVISSEGQTGPASMEQEG
jgi:uncharacterized oligopeptide transporter (OPT) family protein